MRLPLLVLSLALSLAGACPLDSLTEKWSSPKDVKRNLQAIAEACNAPGLPNDSLTLARIQFHTMFGDVYNGKIKVQLRLNEGRDEEIIPWFNSLMLNRNDFALERRSWFTARQKRDSVQSLVTPKLLMVSGYLMVFGSLLAIPVVAMESESEKAIKIMGTCMVLGPILSLLGYGWSSYGEAAYNEATVRWVEKAIKLSNRKVILEYQAKIKKTP